MEPNRSEGALRGVPAGTATSAAREIGCVGPRLGASLLAGAFGALDIDNS